MSGFSIQNKNERMIFLNKHLDSFFNDLDDETVEEISNTVNGMDDKMKERVIEKCKQKMSSDYARTENIRVCSHHKWYRSRIAATAAGLIIVAGVGYAVISAGGGLTGGMKNKSDNFSDKESNGSSISYSDNEMNMAAGEDQQYDDNTNYQKNEEGAKYDGVSENKQESADSAEDKNITETEPEMTETEPAINMDQIAAELVEKYYNAYTIVFFGHVDYDPDDYFIVEGSDNHYCKVTDPKYTSVADIESLLESCFTQNVIELKGYKNMLYGEYPKFVEQDGSLYVKERPVSWPVNLTETPSQIEDVSSDAFTAVKEYDNFGMTEHIVFRIINTDNGWRIDSYDGDYEN